MSQGRFSWVCGENVPTKEMSLQALTKQNVVPVLWHFKKYILEGSSNHLKQGSSVTNTFLDEVGSSAVSLPWVLTPPSDFTVCVYQV